MTHNVDFDGPIQQKLVSDCNASRNGLIYNVFKNNILLSKNYLNSSAFMNTITTLLRFRTNNQKLLIDTDGWNNLPRNQKFCNLCKRNLGDKYHYIYKYIIICLAFHERINKSLSTIFVF